MYRAADPPFPGARRKKWHYIYFRKMFQGIREYRGITASQRVVNESQRVSEDSEVELV